MLQEQNALETLNLDKPQVETWSSDAGLWSSLRRGISCKVGLGTLLTDVGIPRTGRIKRGYYSESSDIHDRNSGKRLVTR